MRTAPGSAPSSARGRRGRQGAPQAAFCGGHRGLGAAGLYGVPAGLGPKPRAGGDPLVQSAPLPSRRGGNASPQTELRR